MLGKLKGMHRQNDEAPPPPQHIIALDIGTENVKALIGRIEDDTVEIVGVGRAKQQLADMQAGAIADIAGVVANCDRALTMAEKMAGVSVRSTVIGIAGELVQGMTSTVTISRKQPDRPLDLPEVLQIIGLVQERALQKARQQLAADLGGKEVEIRLVNSALVSLMIDGYAVTNPVGFQGRDVLVQLYTAFAPLIHIGALERTAKELDLELLAVAAEPFAVARGVIGNDPSASMSAILMDVGGGTTDIAVVNDGGVEGTKMFGIGGRAYTRAIERELGIEYKEAEALKLAINGNRLPQHKTAKAIDALQRTVEVWRSGVEIALGEFAHLDHLPHRILLCGGGSSLSQLVEALARTTWYEELPFTRKPAVQHIQPGSLAGIVDKTGDVNDHTYITAMGLLRVGLDTLNQQDPEYKAGSIRQRINRILSV